jgi:hypothetical protein
VAFVLQNDTYEVTGNQPVRGRPRRLLRDGARGGLWACPHLADAASYEKALPSLLEGEGPVLVTVQVEPAPSRLWRAVR